MSVSIGIDVAKDKLDIFYNDQCKVIQNTAKAIGHFFSKIDKSCLIVMEATGVYHRMAHRELETLGFGVMIINPYQSKNFAKSMNVLCKTDKVDAKILCIFGERMAFTVTPCPSIQQQKTQDLMRHIDDLKLVKMQVSARNNEINKTIKKSFARVLKSLEKSIRDVELELKEMIMGDDELKQKVILLNSIPGIGMSTAIMLLSYMKELGALNKRQIAALAGLAPVCNDSGTHKGKRSIRGGRHGIRSHLYMPILGAATMHNKRLKAFYDKLVASGKRKKVALTACMRKMIVWANAILQSGQPWQENMA